MKKIKFVILAVITIIFFSVVSSYASASHPEIILNGVTMVFDDATGYPFVDNYSRTQVPLRASMEAIGCSVEWDELTYSVSISKGNTSLVVPVGEYYIIRNGVKVLNDTCAQIINGRTYLPIRAIYEAFGAYVSWNNEHNCVDVNTLSPLMQIFFIDVGQGDSALVDFGSYEILVDAGDVKAGATVVNNIKPYIDGDLELVIATHPDSDHIGGMAEVFKAYTINRIIDSGYAASTNTYSVYVDSVNAENCLISQDSDEIIHLGNGAYIKIIETGDFWSTSNDMSVVAELVYGSNSVLFTGDISDKVEGSTLSGFEDTDILKVAHHGSSSSTSQAFLNVVKPEYAIISAGKNNSYGHPRSDTLTRLMNSGTNVLGTFKSGIITLSMNNSSFNFSKTDYLSLNDAGALVENGYNNGVNLDSDMYTGNLNSKKFHYKTCTYALKMKQENIVRFTSRSDAVSSGYMPCNICNP